MPEQPGHFHPVDVPVGVGLPQLRSRPPEVGDHDRAAEHVQRMQRGEGEVNRGDARPKSERETMPQATTEEFESYI